ncbi:hypothetical protein Q7C36_004397 [Tachysurus vachellii]|uniref:Uncharacterized protein n=1 Tax=Tachysurus vachellii TaxID=175792 RepID=A0AA88NJT5_TACVA|nr:hypothetical protein Q7C36_004397 [Tachysurus vachellii]
MLLISGAHKGRVGRPANRVSGSPRLICGTTGPTILFRRSSFDDPLSTGSRRVSVAQSLFRRNHRVCWDFIMTL